MANAGVSEHRGLPEERREKVCVNTITHIVSQHAIQLGVVQRYKPLQTLDLMRLPYRSK